MSTVPPPPPGFELISAPEGIPPPPEGFELVGEGAGRFAQPNLAGSIDPRGRADREVANENLGPKPLAFGLPIVGPYLEEATSYIAAAPNFVTGGAVGPTREQSLERMRARNRKAEADYPVQDFVGQNAAGIAVGGPILNKVFKPGATMLSNVLRGGAAGTVIGGIEGFGRGEGGIENRLNSAAGQAALGGAVGAVLPPVVAGVAKGAGVIADAISPTIARMGASPMGQRINSMIGSAEPPPRSLSAAAPEGGGMAPPPGNGLPPITGADAAAEQLIANQLARANVNTTDIRQRFAQARQASSGQPNVTALADLDPSLARLGGSVQRQQPEAGNIARSFIQGRQTGITPQTGMPDGTGIQTRAMMEMPAPNAPPMGQGERVRTALREALNIPPGSTYRNEQAMIAAQRAEADNLYGDAYRAASGVNVRPAIEPVLQRWLQRAADEPREISRAIIQAVRLYQAPSGTVGTLQRFQRSKEFLDGKIENYMDSIAGRNRALGGMLNEMQRELLGAVDQIPNVGARYALARGAFSTRAEMREAIELGRAAARESAEVSAGQYQQLTPGQQQMFRMGLFGELERRIASMPRQNDVTRIFDTPQMQELMQVISSQPQAQRLGRFVQGEKNMLTGTRNEVLGNSKTAERLADDEAVKQMSGLIEQLRSTRTLRDAAFAVTQKTLDTLFGFRADTAASAARMLFNANPRDVDRILMQIERRLGPDRAAQFRTLMSEHYAAIVRQASAAAPQQQQQPTAQPQNPFERPPGWLPPDPKPRTP